jgi:tetratricopeptide (TPR) repeat protein
MNRLWLGRSIAVAIALVVGAAQVAHAQQDQETVDAEARSLFEAGRTAYGAGRYEAALRYFDDAYELSRRAGLLFNIASSAERLQQNERALEAYRAYLAAEPEAENRAFVERRIAFLESRATEVATPEEAAATVATEPRGAPVAPLTDSGGDVTGEWWFWTIIAAVVVVAAVGIGVGVALGADSGVQEPLAGDLPVVMALEER